MKFAGETIMPFGRRQNDFSVCDRRTELNQRVVAVAAEIKCEERKRENRNQRRTKTAECQKIAVLFRKGRARALDNDADGKALGAQLDADRARRIDAEAFVAGRARGHDLGIVEHQA
jgi:hypothetical protein